MLQQTTHTACDPDTKKNESLFLKRLSRSHEKPMSKNSTCCAIEKSFSCSSALDEFLKGPENTCDKTIPFFVSLKHVDDLSKDKDVSYIDLVKSKFKFQEERQNVDYDMWLNDYKNQNSEPPMDEVLPMSVPGQITDVFDSFENDIDVSEDLGRSAISTWRFGDDAPIEIDLKVDNFVDEDLTASQEDVGCGYVPSCMTLKDSSKITCTAVPSSLQIEDIEDSAKNDIFHDDIETLTVDSSAEEDDTNDEDASLTSFNLVEAFKFASLLRHHDSKFINIADAIIHTYDSATAENGLKLSVEQPMDDIVQDFNEGDQEDY